jgi:hypothetical protein
MRDNHQGMPEIIDALEKDGQYFGIVRIQVSSESKQFQFGISANGYRALRKILQLRPFDTMPGIKQRYFFAGSYGRIPKSSEFRTDVRVEQNREGKKVEVRVPKDLLSNLVWFAGITDFGEAAHLPESNRRAS